MARGTTRRADGRTRRARTVVPSAAERCDGPVATVTTSEVCVSDDIDEMGPIDYLVVEFPKGAKPTGEGFAHLVDLVDRGIIRILDLVFVQKGLDGSVGAILIADLDRDGDLDMAIFEGASSGIIGDDDLNEVGGVLEPGTAGAILVYENVWAGPFAASLRRAGAQLVANGRIPVQALIAALDATDA
jgi:hypothetical protein